MFEWAGRTIMNITVDKLMPKPGMDTLDMDSELAAMETRVGEIGAVSASQVSGGDFMENVIGLEKEKRIVRAVVLSEKPTHLLLVGPPGSAKSVILDEIANLAPCSRASGGTSTNSGITKVLVDDKLGADRLVIDELDKASKEEYRVLHDAMEGRVDVMKHNQNASREVSLRVYASANDIEIIPGPIRDRFTVVSLKPYTPQEYKAVVTGVLVQEGVEPPMARYIADLAESTGARSVRQARTVGRTAGGDPEQAKFMVTQLMGKPKRTVKPPVAAKKKAATAAPGEAPR